MSQIRHIGIIGLGQIGGSIAAALRASKEYKYRIGALELNSRLTDEATSRRLIDYTIDADLEELRKTDLVVLAAPIRAIISVIPAFKRRMAPGSILVDVGGTKREIVAAMEAGDEPIHCFGGHPIVGGVASGADGWNADLFRERPFVLVRTRSSTRGAEELLRTLLRDTGARVVVMDADTHDRAAAHSNDLPLLLANALVALAAQRTGEDVTLIGGAFELATRSVARPPQVIGDTLVTNRDFLAEAYDALDGEVRRLLGVLHRDADGIRRELTHSRVARDRIVPDPKR
jgi:prephenate dehydrogenase